MVSYAARDQLAADGPTMVALDRDRRSCVVGVLVYTAWPRGGPTTRTAARARTGSRRSCAVPTARASRSRTARPPPRPRPVRTSRAASATARATRRSGRSTWTATANRSCCSRPAAGSGCSSGPCRSRRSSSAPAGSCSRCAAGSASPGWSRPTRTRHSSRRSGLAPMIDEARTAAGRGTGLPLALARRPRVRARGRQHRRRDVPAPARRLHRARAAITVRAMQEGKETGAAPGDLPPTSRRRRFLVIGGIVLFAAIAATTMAFALGARLPGDTITGRSRGGTAEASRRSGWPRSRPSRRRTRRTPKPDCRWRASSSASRISPAR